MELKRELDDIERRLLAGEDIRKDFWKLVGRVKRLRVKDDETIERLSSMREKIFKRKILMGFNSGFFLFSTFFVLFNLVFIYLSLGLEEGLPKAFGIFVTEFGVIYFTFLVGRCLGSLLSGIGIDGFYRYTPFEFGVKVNYRDYLKAEPKRRVLLYTGAIALEHIILIVHVVFLYAINSYWMIPAFFLAVNLPFSYLMHRYGKTGELHRFLRELKIMREVKGE